MHALAARSNLVAFGAVLFLLLVACGDDPESTAEDSGESTQTTPATSPAGSEPEPSPADAGGTPTEITFALGSDMTALDPQSSTTDWVNVVHYGNVSETLVTLDTEGALVGQLATSWEPTGDTTWQVELQEGVTYHNGEAFNAEAAAFSIERIISEEFGAGLAGFLSAIESVEVVDETTIDIQTDGPAPFLGAALTIIPMVPPEFTASAPDALENEGIGTGPYLMVSRSEEDVVLEKNPDYWGGPPSGPDRVRIVSRPEASSRVAGLEAGETDIIAAVPPELADGLPNSTSVPAARQVVMALNAFNGPTEDPRVREAIMLAVDREGIRESLFGDTALPVGCQFGDELVEGHFPEDPELTAPQPYDPERARQLLEEAGAVGSALRLVVPIGRYPGAELWSEVAAQQLQEVGFEVELLPMEFQSFLDTVQVPKEDKVELFVIGASFESRVINQAWNFYIPEESPYTIFPHHEFPDLVPTIDAAFAELDEDARSELLRTAAATICEANSVMFAYQPTSIYGYADRISFPTRRDDLFPFVDVTVEQ